MSLTGPLRGKKTYLKQILEPKDIRLLDVRDRTTSPAISYYQFMWDTATTIPKSEVIETTLMSYLEGLLVRVVRSSIRSERVVSRRTSRSVSVSFRHMAQVEISIDTQSTLV
ncbi:MAG: hypothetical protein ACFE7R_08980 [Candidatus Hodarchaeota archaeon]